MPGLITYLLLFFLAGLGFLVTVEYLARRAMKLLLLQALPLALATLILRWTVGFPSIHSRQAFGNASPEATIALMFFFILLGMAAQYYFSLESHFEWRSFLKPFFVSPIILLPLIGTTQSLPNVETMQLISTCILAFQNGFFWRVIFERAESES